MSEVLQPKRPVRKHVRVEMSGKVFVHNAEQIFIAPLANISRGGIFIGKLVSLAVGETVKVVVKTPELARPIQATGVIVRVETEDRMGSAVHFDWIDPEAVEQLAL